jgi:hypothetical protein
VLLTHGTSTSVGKTAVPGSSDVNTGRENRVTIGETDTDGRVLQTESIDTMTRNRAGLTDAVTLVFEES